MSAASFESVPTERRQTARAALEAAFGATPPDELRAVAGGASGALTYRVEAAGKSYLLRMETRRGPLRNPHQYECMRIAAEAGIAPALRHVDADAGVAVMDFVQPQPHGDYPDGPSALARDLGRLAARLQKTRAFPPLANFPRAVERIFGFVRGSQLFSSGLLDAHAAGFERVRAAYHWDESALTSSHNDPNPQNVIFDGERLWLVDWETAYRNDPLTDVAILLDSFAQTPALEQIMVEAWLGREPDRTLRARLALMRQLTRLYYAGLLLSFAAAAPRAAPEMDLGAPTPEEFRAAVARGEHAPTSPATLFTLGKMQLAEFLSGMNAPGFDEALAIARNTG
ncbi:MAG TPA: phosphotransferase [Gammaproteobacteria bacterium]|nr:phosphotransferase [Gammaproteobacteria bacterium]